jgi:ATP-dependent DNA helicase RecG
VIARFFKEIGRVDELGSGVRNTFKYCGIYSSGTIPEFIEGDIFKTIIPLKDDKTSSEKSQESLYELVADAVNDAVSDAVSDAVKVRLIKELIIIITKNGISIDELKKQFQIERATAQRDMKQLKDIGLVDFVGVPKTGKYMLSDKGRKKFTHNNTSSN